MLGCMTYFCCTLFYSYVSAFFPYPCFLCPRSIEYTAETSHKEKQVPHSTLATHRRSPPSGVYKNPAWAYDFHFSPPPLSRFSPISLLVGISQHLSYHTFHLSSRFLLPYQAVKAAREGIEVTVDNRSHKNDSLLSQPYIFLHISLSQDVRPRHSQSSCEETRPIFQLGSRSF